MKDVKEKLEELYDMAITQKDVTVGLNIVYCQITVERERVEAKQLKA